MMVSALRVAADAGSGASTAPIWLSLIIVAVGMVPAVLAGLWSRHQSDLKNQSQVAKQGIQRATNAFDEIVKDVVNLQEELSKSREDRAALHAEITLLRTSIRSLQQEPKSPS